MKALRRAFSIGETVLTSKPEWLEEWKRRTRIISIIEKAYEIDCDCEVCEAVRELGEEMGEMFKQAPPQIPQLPGGVPGSRKKRKRK